MSRTPRKHQVLSGSLLAAITLTAITALATPAQSQNLSDRIQQVRDQSAAESPASQNRAEEVPIRQRMGYLIADLSLTDVTARDAILWWAKVTSVPLVVDWRNLENEGVNPDTPVNIQGQRVPVALALSMILKQVSPEFPQLLYQQTPHFVEVMTKEQANRQAVVRVYDINDLTFEVRNFDNAPQFDLDSVLQGGQEFGGGQGGGGGGNQSIFGGSGTQGDRDDQPPTRAERGQEIAQLIRDTIEPDIWQLNGGQYASIRFFDGRLVINAPLYVHDQIALPRAGLRQSNGASSAARTSSSQSTSSSDSAAPVRRTTSNQPAGVAGSATPVARKQPR